MLTDANGNVRATYGYNPYGEDDSTMFTGVDKPDAQNPEKEMYNPYRYGGKRWDPLTQSYDLGFRDYFPSLGRFMTPDSYNDSVANKGIVLDPANNNLYAFAAGNPISFTDLDGHWSFSGLVNRYVVNPIKKAVKKTVGVIKSTAKKVAQVVKKTYNKVKSYSKQIYYKTKAVIRKTYRKTKKVIAATYRKTKKYVKSTIKRSSRSSTKAKSKPSSVAKKKATPAKKWSSGGSTPRQVASIGGGFVPVVSELNDVGVTLFGYDLIAGEDTPRWMGIAGLLAPAGGAGAIKAVSKSSSKVADMVRSCKCFTAGTKVKTSKGDKPIEEVQVGDQVLAKDDKTGKQAYKEVEWLFQKQVDKLYEIHVGKEVIQTTEEHPFWIKGFGWVGAEDLRTGMLLEDEHGKLLRVDK
jgi:RHS repeat-associated protein